MNKETGKSAPSALQGLLPCGADIFLKRMVVILLVVCAAAALMPRLSWSENIEIVARVNGQPLSRAELEQLIADPAVAGMLHDDLVRHADQKSTAHMALQLLIQRCLLVQEASRKKIVVDEGDVDQAISALRRRFETVEQFGAWMHERGLDDQSLFAAIRNGMLANRVAALLVEGVHVSADEVSEYYAARREALQTGEEVRLRMIVADSEQSAADILDALRAGEDFGSLAAQRSLGMRAGQGGDTGWINVETLSAPLKNVVNLLEVGDVAGPLHRADGRSLLVGLAGRRPLEMTTLAAAAPAIERWLLASRQKEALRQWLDVQQSEAEVEILLDRKQPVGEGEGQS